MPLFFVLIEKVSIIKKVSLNALIAVLFLKELNIDFFFALAD